MKGSLDCAGKSDATPLSDRGGQREHAQLKAVSRPVGHRGPKNLRHVLPAAVGCLVMPKQQARFAEIVEHHGPFVRSLALRLAPAPGLAEDIAQQVFLEFVAKGDQWDLDRDVQPLLATMTRHVALRCWRDRTRVMSAEMRGLAEHIRALAEGTEVEWYRPEEQAALRQCLEQLSEKSHRFVELHYELGVSSVEIAARMQMTADAVRRALFRLREQLRKCIQASVATGLK